ncbi:Tat pathway signal protein [Streptomyces tendae]|uniref:golvesin C-terminal-like domain-containing protein n=1 Tax=Streptomyces tendae TaxID=1932 RepID=UPI003718673F
MALSGALAGGLIQATPAAAAPEPTTGGKHAPHQSSGRVSDPGRQLGKGWKSSEDRAVTSAADADGLHILLADSAKAYDWNTVATLAEPGMPADSWIGNTCVMDHTHAAVAYAPRSFTNKPDLMQGGAFTAIVNLNTGQVTKLPFTASLAYFDPSCNKETRTAAFSAFRDGKTRLLTVSTSGQVLSDATAAGQVTSAVPLKDGVIAARGRHLVRVATSGKISNLAATDGVPFEIRPAAKGHVAFLDHTKTTAQAKLWRGHGKAAVVASGNLGDLSLTQGESRRVFLTGKPTGAVHLEGTGITRLDAPANTDVSSHGRLAVDPVLTPAMRAGLDRVKNAGKEFTKAEPDPSLASSRGGSLPGGSRSDEPLTVTSTATVTGQTISQEVTAESLGQGDQFLSPSLSAPSGEQEKSARTTAAADMSHNPVDTDRWCSIPRNDVNAQALQPTPNQVEWAVDMAVRGELRSQWINQGGWRSQTGLSTIDPQGLFPPPTLKGGGRIPAQVLLGVLAQESNLWQAESGAIPGQMGNPLAAVAGFYGHKGTDLADYWKIHWDDSDCGYGVGQVTDGMRLAGHEKPGETGLSPAAQKAVTLDYTVNIAASMYILADKWNEIHTSGQTITVNNDDPSRPENWFAALWNYNLGFNPASDASKNNGHWGLGWYNNPANPFYPPSRLPFMDTSVDPDANHDAAHPQDWPYEEKVMGWAAWSIDTGHSYATSGRQDWPGESGFSSAGFRPSWWVDAGQRAQIKPPLDAFCNEANNCDAANPPDCPDAVCYQQYWWNGGNVTWKDNCDTNCGNENIKYATLRAEPGRGYRLQYGTPVCSGAPAGSLVVESVPAGTNTWSDCGTTSSDGNFQFTFYPDADGQYEAKGDLHQIGGGYQGHFWYAHERDPAHLGGAEGRMTVLGTWKLNGPMAKKQAKVYVHIPDTGAQTRQATYEVVTALGTHKVTIDQYANESNRWVLLGAFRFNDQTPVVRLSNANSTGTADRDVAWDAVAFVPGEFGVPGGRLAGLELPDPDYSAPDVDFVDNDQQEQPAPSGLTPNPLFRSPSLTPDEACAKGLENGEGRQCVTFKPLTTPSPKARATAGAGTGLSTTLVPWCAQTGLTQTYTIERREGCLAFTALVNWTKKDPNGTVKNASAAFNVFVETKTQNKATFTERMSVVPVDMDAQLGAVSLDYWDTPCTPSCSTSYTQNWSGATWLSIVDRHWASATKANTWTNPVKDTSESFDRGVFLSFKAESPEWKGLIPVKKPEISLFDQIRCDNSVSVPNSTGCIFRKHIPTFTLNDAKYPAAAAYYWLLREELPSHPGSEKEKKPLHRERDKDVREKNRGKICPTSFTPNTEATPEATTNSPGGRQCDEYPFAATKESGGQSVTGDKCVQLYAKKSASDGKWRLHVDNGYPAPTWQEVCGRASMSAKQNEAAGRGLSSFYTKARVADNDPFYIKAPSLENCRPDEVCVVNP